MPQLVPRLQIFSRWYVGFFLNNDANNKIHDKRVDLRTNQGNQIHWAQIYHNVMNSMLAMSVHQGPLLLKLINFNPSMDK